MEKNKKEEGSEKNVRGEIATGLGTHSRCGWGNSNARTK